MCGGCSGQIRLAHQKRRGTNTASQSMLHPSCARRFDSAIARISQCMLWIGYQKIEVSPYLQSAV